jgi:hypothetical protein
LLKKTAIPSQNLPKIVRQFDENSSRAIRTAARAVKIAESVNEQPPCQTIMFVDVFDAVDKNNSPSLDEWDESGFKEVACQTDASPNFADAACQVG